MNILFVNKRSGCSSCFSLGRAGTILISATAFLLIPAVSLFAGYQLGHTESQTTASSEISTTLQDEMQRQREEVAEARKVAEENLNALTLRLGQLQAHVVRLDALGQRLTQIAGLDDGEFNFEEVPARGGPQVGGELGSISHQDFISQLDELGMQLDDRAQQLGLLETMLVNRSLQEEVSPAGRPVLNGWISSRYGKRADPFTGKQEMHKGVDVAGKEGSEVIAVAAGVVTWAGKRYGYGDLVEIDHGNGYVTRYGHNKEHKVKVGDTVKKGQVIALMGSTGRSTGPHVHFEVIQNGKTVDPQKYITASN